MCVNILAITAYLYGETKIGGWLSRLTERQTDRQTDRQANKQTPILSSTKLNV